MNKKFIIQFLSCKVITYNHTTSELEKMIQLFPYCETIRKIDILIKNKNEDITFEETLPKVAIYSSNRKSLFLLLLKESNPVLFNQISDKEKINLKNKKRTFHDWIKTSFSSAHSSSLDLENKKPFTKKTTNTDDLMTETLAKLYLEQGHFEQAIRAYQILRLKYPKKSSLFASEIKKITKLKFKNEL